MMEAEALDNKAGKAAYKRRLAEAVKWLRGVGHAEKPATAARSAKNIYNMDEAGARIRYPKGE